MNEEGGIMISRPRRRADTRALREAHVVIERQPADRHALLLARDDQVRQALMRHEVTVRDHDALGHAGRSARVLQKREPILEPLWTSIRGRVESVELVGHQQRDLACQWTSLLGELCLRSRRRDGQDKSRVGLGDDRVDPRHGGPGAPRLWRIGRDGDEARVETREEGDRVVQAGREDEQRPSPGVRA